MTEHVRCLEEIEYDPVRMKKRVYSSDNICNECYHSAQLCKSCEDILDQYRAKLIEITPLEWRVRVLENAIMDMNRRVSM